MSPLSEAHVIVTTTLRRTRPLSTWARAGAARGLAVRELGLQSPLRACPSASGLGHQPHAPVEVTELHPSEDLAAGQLTEEDLAVRAERQRGPSHDTLPHP